MVERNEAKAVEERAFPLMAEEFDAELLRKWRDLGSAQFAVWVVQTHIEGSARAYASDVEATVAIVADLQSKFPAVFTALAEMRQEVTRV